MPDFLQMRVSMDGKSWWPPRSGGGYRTVTTDYMQPTTTSPGEIHIKTFNGGMVLAMLVDWTDLAGKITTLDEMETALPPGASFILTTDTGTEYQAVISEALYFNTTSYSVQFTETPVIDLPDGTIVTVSVG